MLGPQGGARRLCPITQTQHILETPARLKKEIRAIPELQMIGDPLFMVTMRSDVLDVYRLMEFMT